MPNTYNARRYDSGADLLHLQPDLCSGHSLHGDFTMSPPTIVYRRSSNIKRQTQFSSFQFARFPIEGLKSQNHCLMQVFAK